MPTAQWPLLNRIISKKCHPKVGGSEEAQLPRVPKGLGGPGLPLGWLRETWNGETQPGDLIRIGIQSLFKIPADLRSIGHQMDCLGIPGLDPCACFATFPPQSAAPDLPLHPHTLKCGFFSPKSLREACPAHLQLCGVSGQWWGARPCPQAVSPGPAHQLTAAGGCCR